VALIVPVLDALDPFVVNSVYQATITAKSAALALALIYMDGTVSGRMTLEQCCNIARLDERHQ
jgi:chaperone required for assembly of F1-ATPase